MVFLAIYLISWGGHYTSGDASQKRAWAKAMLHLPGGGPSKFAVGNSLLVAPPIWLAALVQTRAGFRCEAALCTLLWVVNGAVLLGMIAYYLAKFYPANTFRFAVAAIGLGTFWWPYTKLDFAEPIVATLLFAGFLAMKLNRPVLGMFVASWAITLREDAVLLLGFLFLWYMLVTRNFSRIPMLLVAGLPSLMLVLAGNWVRYGALANLGYHGERFSYPFLSGLHGILFSGGKSVFLFSPPLVLGFFYWDRFRKRLRADAWFFLGVFVIQTIEYASWWDWSGDDAWGVRFLIPAVMLMSIPIIEAPRVAVVLAALVGMAVQLLPVTVGGLSYLMLMRQQHAYRQALYVGGMNRVDFEDIRDNPKFSQITGTWILLRCLLGVPPRSTQSEAAKNGSALYDTLPAEAWRSASWDFIWTGAGRTGEADAAAASR